MKGKFSVRIKCQILKFFVILTSAFWTISVSANEIISTSAKAAVVVTQSTSQQRVCHYNDKAYSVGAIVEVSGVVIKCAAENDFETNGDLGWVEIIKKDE